MKNLYLDIATKDLEVYGNNFRFTETPTEYVSQKADNNFHTWKGEHWLDVTLGIPYRDKIDSRDSTKNILGVVPDINVLSALFLVELKSISEIKRVLKLNIEKDDPYGICIINWTVSLSDNKKLSSS